MQLANEDGARWVEVGLLLQDPHLKNVAVQLDALFVYHFVG